MHCHVVQLVARHSLTEVVWVDGTTKLEMKLEKKTNAASSLPSFV